MIVEDRYTLPQNVVDSLDRPINWGFNSLSEAVYYRTYSRSKGDGSQESWKDTVCRVVEGVLSIRKDWLTNTIGVRWNREKYDSLAYELANYMYDMKFLPPGRGLWAMGTDFVYEKGSMALSNCAAVEVKDDLAKTASWLFDALMVGSGVGFGLANANLKLRKPTNEQVYFQIPDSREGWVESTRQLISSYENGGPQVKFDYSLIRPAGKPIRGFGGISAGPDPLMVLHKLLRESLDLFVEGKIDQTRLIADVMNSIGVCVVSGNVRRSAQIAIGSPYDSTFLNLKNYSVNPERKNIGFMSNNSVALSEREHFSLIPQLAERILDNGEPGLINLINIQKYGRLGERYHDDASLVNPCAEICLESMETCNLSEVFPTRCNNSQEIFTAMRLATFYCSTVALLRSHSTENNEVVSRNRRIGVSVSGVADWIDNTSVSNVFNILNRGYEEIVRPVNEMLAKEAGVNESIRVTTVKPSGSISLLAGVSPGVHYPSDTYVIRRMRMAKNSQVAQVLLDSGVPHEDDEYTPNTLVFEFPVEYGNGKTRSIKNVSLYEQAASVAMLQKAWADNAVSNTLTIQPNEFHEVERVISYFAPQVKSLSMLPDINGGAYKQMPVESITKDEYEKRLLGVKNANWRSITGTDGRDSKYCDSDACEL